MKNSIIAILIGAIIMFAYQAMSWMFLPTHANSHKYTSQQDSILSAMQGLEDGAYYLPMAGEDPTVEEERAFMDASIGKPWAMVFYHPSLEMNMGKTMGIGFLIDLIAVWLFVWMLRKGNIKGIGGTVSFAFVLALIIIVLTACMDMNWFSSPMHYQIGNIADLILMWFFTSLWLGWFLNRKTKTA